MNQCISMKTKILTILPSTNIKTQFKISLKKSLHIEDYFPKWFEEELCNKRCEGVIGMIIIYWHCSI